MSDPRELARLFLPQAPTQGSEALEAKLRTHWEKGHASWPGVDLPAPSFVSHLARHLPHGAEPTAFLADLHAADLYLACACAQGLPAALATFDAHFLSQVAQAVARIDGTSAFADEVRQRLRHKLMVAEAGGVAKITSYNGGTALSSWLRVVALREAIDLRRQQQPGRESDLTAALPTIQDPMLLHLQARYATDFRAALRDAIAGLAPEQRNTLRLHYARGLTGDRIAALLRVSRPTVVRWLASARSTVFQETRRLLQERLRLPPSEFDSIIEAIRSRLDLSLSTLFRSEE